MFDFSELKKHINGLEVWLKKELLNIQTGRATPAILDNVLVDSYGSKMHVKEVASIATEDARTLRVVPWETDNIRSIEVAIRDSDLGVGVSVDEKGLRVSFPELTAERREQMKKLVGKKLEEAHISLRQERDRVWHDIVQQEKKNEISEDDKFRYKEEMEKTVQDGNARLKDLAEKKEQELSG